MKTIWKRISTWFFALTQREKVIVATAAIATALYLIWAPLTALQENLDVPEERLLARKREMMDIGALLRRYAQLADRVRTLEATYADSQMTFEQVTVELDKVVRESIGSDNYELKKNPTAREIGNQLEQQDFTLRIRSLSLEQLVKLLYKLEHGEAALFLGKLDVTRAPGPAGELSATLEVSSVGKRRAA